MVLVAAVVLVVAVGFLCHVKTLLAKKTHLLQLQWCFQNNPVMDFEGTVHHFERFELLAMAAMGLAPVSQAFGTVAMKHLA